LGRFETIRLMLTLYSKTSGLGGKVAVNEC